MPSFTLKVISNAKKTPGCPKKAIRPKITRLKANSENVAKHDKLNSKLEEFAINNAQIASKLKAISKAKSGSKSKAISKTERSNAG